MSQYGEPWTLDPDGDIATSDNCRLEMFHTRTDYVQRIAACVNVCAGIPDERIAELACMQRIAAQEALQESALAAGIDWAKRLLAANGYVVRDAYDNAVDDVA